MIDYKIVTKIAEYGVSITGIHIRPGKSVVKFLCKNFGVEYTDDWVWSNNTKGELYIPNRKKIARANKKIMSGK